MDRTNTAPMVNDALESIFANIGRPCSTHCPQDNCKPHFKSYCFDLKCPLGSKALIFENKILGTKIIFQNYKYHELQDAL